MSHNSMVDALRAYNRTVGPLSKAVAGTVVLLSAMFCVFGVVIQHPAEAFAFFGIAFAPTIYLFQEWRRGWRPLPTPFPRFVQWSMVFSSVMIVVALTTALFALRLAYDEKNEGLTFAVRGLALFLSMIAHYTHCFADGLRWR